MSAKKKPDKDKQGYETAYENNHHPPISLNHRTLGIDVDYYDTVIDDPDVSDARKRELIEIMGSLVMNFIDIGFGVHPVQLAQNNKADGGLIKLSEEETPSLQLEFKKESASERSDV